MSNKIEDGTEFRDCTMRLRATGVKEIIKGLGPNGFCSLGSGRLMILDDELFFEFCANVGTYESRVLALGIAFMVPLTKEEQSSLTETKPEQEKPDETPPDPTGDPVPQLP